MAEALAEVKRRSDGGDSFRHAFGAGAAGFNLQADADDAFMLGAFENGILDAELRVAGAGGAAFTGFAGIEEDVFPADADGQVGGQPLAKFKPQAGFSSFF